MRDQVLQRYQRMRRYKQGLPGKHTGHAPARNHSVMVVRCSWGDVVLKPWEPR